jgi:hypothetical protein
MLERLMRHGKADETSTDKSELFRTDRVRDHAFKAIVTVSGVNDGSTMQAKFGGVIVNAIKDLLSGISTVATVAGTIFNWDDAAGASLYDFDLTHHMALRQNAAGETFTSWKNRVFAAPEWAPSYDYFAHMDLSPSFQRNFNAAGNRGYSNTKYLAISTSRTGSCVYWIWDQCPTTMVEAIMAPTATAAGNLDNVCDMRDPTLCFTDADEENDGLMSRIATRGPHTGTLIAGTTDPKAMILKTVCDSKCLWPLNSLCCSSHEENDWANMVGGQWYYLDFNYDHLQSVGFQSTGFSGALEDPVGEIWRDNILPFVNSV